MWIHTSTSTRAGSIEIRPWWDRSTPDSGTLPTTTTAGASISYDFYGDDVQYLAETNASEGSVDVYVDNQLQSTATLNTSSALETQQTVYSKSGLRDGLHTIKIVSKTTAPVNVDGFRVLSDRPASVAGRTFGVATPGSSVVTCAANLVEDPDHGQTLTTHLQNTVSGSADVTLVEGMTDWSENAMIARTAEGTYAERHTDYPNQMLDIMRQFSADPFPREMQVEAETADAVTRATPGNNGVYRDGDIDVEATIDTGGGYDVGSMQNGESLTWQSEAMQGTVDLKVRVATPNDGSQLRFVIDGVSGPTITVPNTGGWQTYSTVDAGTFQLAPGVPTTRSACSSPTAS